MDLSFVTKYLIIRFCYVDFIKPPVNTTFIISEDAADMLAVFQCSTRSGDVPLWIVNAVSVSTIRNTSGYANTQYDLFGLQGQGHFLSFLSIPVSYQTNNSMVVCVAIANGEPVAFSQPAYLIVLHSGGKILCVQKIQTVDYFYSVSQFLLSQFLLMERK